MFDKHLMQFSQGRDRHPRRPQLHAGTSGGIEHPRRHDQHIAGRHLDIDNLAAGAPLDILTSNPAPIQRMPAVMDLNLLPDMGRMTARLRSIAKMPCSLARTAVPSIGRLSLR